MQIDRIIYDKPCEYSRKDPTYSFFSGEILGYEELDDHYRDRIMKEIEKESTNE